MHSNVTDKNVSWPQFSWATLYIFTILSIITYLSRQGIHFTDHMGVQTIFDADFINYNRHIINGSRDKFFVYLLLLYSVRQKNQRHFLLITLLKC